MMVRVSTTIEAPVERVFEVFTDFRRLEERVRGVKKVEFLEKEGRAEVGMKWRETRVMLGKEAMEVMWITEMNTGRNYVVEAASHGVKYRSEYVFEDRGGVTEVTLTFAGTPVTFGARVMSWLGFLFVGSVKKALAADMADLKRVAEEG